MTSDKHTAVESKLESVLKSIDVRLHEIKGIVAGMYDQIADLEQTAEAVYKTVSYQPSTGAYAPDDDFDLIEDD